MGIIKKMYGKAVLIEEINRLLTDTLYKYISENKIKVLGEPMPVEDEQKQIDWDNDKIFEFCFEIALAPDIEVKFPPDEKIDYYNISPDEHLIDLYKESYASRFGSYQNIEVSTGDEMVTGNFIQLDKEGSVLADGIKCDGSKFLISTITEESVKNKFIGVKAGEKITFDLKKAFPDKTDLRSMLKLDKNKEHLIENDFEFTITEISIWTKAAYDTDLYDRIYGKDVVKTEDEFKEKIIQEINHHLSDDSNFKFRMDVKEKLLSSISFDLNSNLLKRWLLESDKTKMTREKIEEEYPAFERDLRWQIIKDNFISSNEIKVTDEEILQLVKESLLMQYRQYGLTNIPEGSLEKYAGEFMDNPDEKHKFMEKILEDKVYDNLKHSVNLNFIEISHDAFEELTKEH